MRDYMAAAFRASATNVGTPYDKGNAEWAGGEIPGEFGLDTHLETFDILYPTPKKNAPSNWLRAARSSSRNYRNPPVRG